MQAPASSNTAPASGAAASENASALRACSTSGCQVSKYVEVTKRKCAQFVTAPRIMEKPLVVNGKTSIFQVGGDMAKLSDIPAVSAATGGSGQGQPIYRIKPGTHAHIVNYVFIDGGADASEMGKLEDQKSISIMLNSHRDSATSKLLKLTSMHRGGGGGAAQTATSATVAHAPALASAVANSVNVTSRQINPNSSVASVESTMLSAASATTATTTNVASPVVAAAPAAASALEGKTIEELQAEVQVLKNVIARHGAGSMP